VKDAYIRYLGLPGWTLTIGNQKPVFSLDHMTGQQHTMLMERSLPVVFGFSESLGIGLATAGDNWSLAFTAFGETPGTELDGDEGYGIAARATVAPVLRDSMVVHLGASGHHKKLTDDQTLRIQQRPEVRIFDTRLVDTGALPAEGTTAAGVEFLGIFGPFTLQTEYMRNWADYRGLASQTYEGAYVQAGWVLTGEMRPYNAATGVASRVIPASPLGEGGWGALELAARFSTLDLNDDLVFGGSEDNFALGLNWHPNRYTRLMVNWVHFNAKGTAANPYGRPDNKGNAFGVRAQVDW
ncbi:MAG TPA: porin, partial [Sphingomonadales bacterium]